MTSRTHYLVAILFAVAQPAAALDVFDLHVHLRNGEASIGDYQAAAREAGLKLAGFGGMWFGGPHQALEGQNERARTQNDQLIAVAAKHSTMVPIATVHPYDGQAALGELKRVAAKGVKVVKLHPHTQRFDPADTRVSTLARLAGDLGVIILMDNAGIIPGDREKLFNLALANPRTKFVFAHMGALDFRFWNLLALARTADDLFADNIYFDISATVVLAADSPIENEFVWTIRNVGVDRVLLGSDFPQFSLAQTVNALERLDLSAEEKAKIRAGNARRLLEP